jgi:uncharacterized surface protein with fasciclin (FAS1) repeats
MHSRFGLAALSAAAFVSASAVSACASPVATQGAVAGGNLVAAASASPDHKTLVAAVKAAGLVDTLAGPGPLTVFAPTDAAFSRLPAGTVDSLLQPANKGQLTSILTYHVVPGRVTAADLVGKINAGGGRAMLTTVQGGTLTASLSGTNVILTDAQGGTATVTAADLIQSNGVIHVTDAVSMPG